MSKSLATPASAPAQTEQFLLEHQTEIKKMVSFAAYRLPIQGWFRSQVEDEVVNEVMLKVWKYFDPSKSALSTYVFRCTKHSYLNLWESHVRRSKNTVNVGNWGDSPDFDEMLLADQECGASDGGIDDVVHEMWVAFLQQEKMTEVQGNVFGLLNSGVRKHEIAEQLGVTTSRVNQVRKRCGELLERDRIIFEAAGRMSYVMNG